MKCVSAAILLLSIWCHSAWSETGIRLSIDMYQSDTVNDRSVLLYSDTAEIAPHIPLNGFLINVSIEIDVTEIDSNQVHFDVHTITQGPQAKTLDKRFTIEYELPARLRYLPGKNDARYELVLTPLTPIDIDTSLCTFNHHAEESFTFSPTAYTDIHFVPNSLADYYFDSIKDLFETEYRAFLQKFPFTTPGKYQIFVCPCRLPSVLWDKRFGQAIDPTSSTTFVVYSHESNTADPFALIHCAIVRNLGYAPAFLSEGLANYFSFADFDVKQFIADNQMPPLRNLLTTYEYFTADPFVADRISASFVQFLIDVNSYALFRTLYTQSDDLSLIQSIEQVYGKSVDELESDWRQYVDTVLITGLQYRDQAQRAEQMQNYTLMLKYAHAYFTNAGSELDSLASLLLLKRAYFFTGEYYHAAETVDRLIQLQPGRARNWMERAAYQMMNGYYEQASDDLMQARKIDTTNDPLIAFNQALNYLLTDRREEAGKVLLKIVSTGDSPASREARIYLAEMLKDSDNPDDHALATAMLQKAASQSEQEFSVQRSSASAYMWAGIAYLELGDTGMASDYLNLALFLETRPFYLGMIYLSLGKVADALGDRDGAREFYQQVLAVQSAHYHKEQAKQFIEKPYQL